MKKEPFSVPENYFKNLPHAIQTRIGQASKLVFTLPADYFEDLPTKIQAHIKCIENNVFEIPSYYFDELPAQIQAKVSPALPATTPIAEVLKVPEQYFENLQHHILRKVNQSKNTHTAISFVWVGKLATASAVIVLGVCLALFGLKNYKTNEVAQNKPKEIKKEIESINKPESKPKSKLESNAVLKNPADITHIEIKIEPVQPTQASNLAKYLETADTATEEAIELLAINEEAASEEGQDEWDNANEDILHEITEAEIASLPQLLKK